MYCHEFLISSALFSKLNLYTKKFVFAEEASPGIYFFNARWYDGSLGRFLSPDTIVPTSTQGTQAWDRYAFVNNNPVRYTDPSGHRVDDGCQTEGCNLTSLQKAINAQKLARLEYDPTGLKQAQNTKIAETILYDGTELIVTLLFEPADWAATAYHCANGDCSPLMLLGLLPLISSNLPSRLARVIPADIANVAETLGSPGALDVFVTGADDIADISSSTQLARRLTLLDETGHFVKGPFAVLEFDAVDEMAVPILRSYLGFTGRGVTLRGAREYVIPNLLINSLQNLIIRIVP